MIAAAVFGAVGYTVYPYTVHHVSTEAVVNAPLSSVTTPVAGRIDAASPPVGAPVNPGQRLFKLAAERTDHRYLSELEARRDGKAETLRSARRLLGDLSATADRLRERLDTYRRTTRASLAAERDQLVALLRSARAEMKAAEQAHTRMDTLAAKDLVPDAQRERATADLEKARADVVALEARLERIDIELRGIDNGTFARNGWNDVPYSQQRLDEVTLRMAETRSRINILASELAALDQQIDAEAQRMAAIDTIVPVAGSEGVVWKESPRSGESLAAGDEVLQVVSCESRIIEVLVSERHFETIQPGDVARIRLKGSARELQAKVAAVRGAGARTPHAAMAAQVPSANEGQLRVIVDLEGTGLSRDPKAFCHVGRTAEVMFPREVPLTRALQTGAAALLPARALAWFGIEAR
ncbi:HlyD family secretion protein [Rhodovibrio sodomensis]|nr:HlyD family efflux transporter periplasmic adaptor subunit [Rhodovibrio sodomensis]